MTEVTARRHLCNVEEVGDYKSVSQTTQLSICSSGGVLPRSLIGTNRY